MGSDWMFNGRLEAGRVKCHGGGDLVRGKNMDWDRIDGDEALLQKLILYFAIPPGEMLNEGNIGCCLHSALFEKLTPDNLALIKILLESELREQIPEIGVQYVEISANETKDGVNLMIVGYNTWLLSISREDLLDINLLDAFSSGVSR